MLFRSIVVCLSPAGGTGAALAGQASYADSAKGTHPFGIPLVACGRESVQRYCEYVCFRPAVHFSWQPSKIFECGYLSLAGSNARLFTVDIVTWFAALCKRIDADQELKIAKQSALFGMLADLAGYISP